MPPGRAAPTNTLTSATPRPRHGKACRGREGEHWRTRRQSQTPPPPLCSIFRLNLKQEKKKKLVENVSQTAAAAAFRTGSNLSRPGRAAPGARLHPSPPDTPRVCTYICVFAQPAFTEREREKLGRRGDENRWRSSVRNTQEKNNRHLLLKPNLVPPSHSSRVQPTELLRQRLVGRGGSRCGRMGGVGRR